MNILKTILLSLSFIVATQLSSQIDFVDELYAKINLENINLFDSLGRSINLSIPTSELFYRKDTSMNCWGEPKEKFINLEYWAYGISQSILNTMMDTSTNVKHIELVDFYRIYYNKYYEISDREYLFSANREEIFPIDKLMKSGHIDEQIVNTNDCFWTLESIKLDNKSFRLDSCHATYKLKIGNNAKYSQSYQNGQRNCDCLITKPIIKEESYDLSLNERVFHKLSMSFGEIRTHGNKLVMTNEDKDSALVFDYTIVEDKLILKNSNNYLITFETNPTCNSR